MALGDRVEGLRERWAARPRWQRWLLTYAALAALGLVVGLATPLGTGNSWFIEGALVMLYSLSFIRLGSHRRTIVHRDIQGRRLFKEEIIDEKRETEIRRGVKVFAMGMALWALLALDVVVRG